MAILPHRLCLLWINHSTQARTIDLCGCYRPVQQIDQRRSLFGAERGHHRLLRDALMGPAHLRQLMHARWSFRYSPNRRPSPGAPRGAATQ